MKKTLDNFIRINDSIVLNRLTDQDINQMVDLLTDPDVSKHTDNIPYPYTRTHAQEWVRLNEHKKTSDPTKVWAIRLQGHLVGLIGCSTFKVNQGLVEIGYWLGKQYWGKGIVSKVVPIFCQYLVQDPRIKKVQAQVKIQNIASQKLLEKCMFVPKSLQNKTHLRFEWVG